MARVLISAEQARWAREQRAVLAELPDGRIIVEITFKGIEFLVREVLKEAGDAVVLEPADAREAVLIAAEGLIARDAAAGAPDRDERRGGARLPRRGVDADLRDRRYRRWPPLTPSGNVVRDGECWAWTYAKSQKVRNL